MLRIIESVCGRLEAAAEKTRTIKSADAMQASPGSM